jgi:putrescine transport system ATP-binding protein
VAATTEASAPLLRLAGVTKRFGGAAAVDAVDLALAENEVFCLLGPSGCGKSTLLRLIAGFEQPDAGTIRLGTQHLTGLPAHRRPINMMFQSYALFPHMSVSRNVAYGLADRPRAERAARVADLLRMVRLEDFADRRPDTLSGGQRQRVALARALAREPRLLLLDEPLTALDRALREETQSELRALQRRLRTSFIVVTHDPEEAMRLADRVGVMAQGRIVQVGATAELYDRPASRYVAGLLGDVNLIPGRLGPVEPGGLRTVETASGSLRARSPAADLSEGDAVVVAVRPERVALGPDQAGEGATVGIPATVAERVFLGDRIARTLHLGDGSAVRASGPPEGADAFPAGARVRLRFAAEAATILPA